ncbi:trypsin-like peptidase domain-containing protein [Longispora sp. K20-0274]|uniref:serine protease n=1 Tax=Longispora sp. K20-0274 TaxID=3088255 RepID=UPI00399A4933
MSVFDPNQSGASLVRVVDPDLGVIGLGVDLGSDLILTCRHVIEGASLTALNSGMSLRGVLVAFDRPLFRNVGQTEYAEVIYCGKGSGYDRSDFAVLKVRSNLRSPSTANALEVKPLWGVKFAAFGCPPGHDAGVWSTGRLLGPTHSGLVTMQAEENTGYSIDHGYSGGPVFDISNGAVLGIVVAKESKAGIRGGFMLPLAEVMTQWPAIRAFARLDSAMSEVRPNDPANVRTFAYGAPGTTAEYSSISRITRRINVDPIATTRIGFELISWTEGHEPDSEQRLMSPTEARIRGLPTPGQCDAVLLIVWGDLGEESTETTAIELILEGLLSTDEPPSPKILLFYRTSPIMVNAGDPRVAERIARAKETADLVEKVKNHESIEVVAYDDENTFERQLDNKLRLVARAKLEKSVDSAPTPSVGPSRRDLAWPYIGLREFRSGDSHLYFGRDQEVDAIIDIAEAGETLTIVGPSGSGKSSMINAGLIPRLESGGIHGSQDWIYVRFTPAELSSDPLAALANRLLSFMSSEVGTAREIWIRLHDDPDGFERVVEKILEFRPHWSRIFLVVDQFEELLTYSASRSRRQFLQLILKAHRHARITLVLSIRADLLGVCLDEPQLAQIIRTRIVTVGQPSEAELFEMLTLPASYVGLDFEAGLPELIVGDVQGSGNGALPLLSYAMAELEEICLVQGSINYQAYQQIGSIRGTLARRAARLMAREGISTQDLAEIFQLLVQVRPDGRSMRVRHFPPSSNMGGRRKVLEFLVAGRLVVIGAAESNRRRYYELAHESLIEHWPELAEWVTGEQERVFKAVRTRNRQAEMGRRRKLATERFVTGAVFNENMGPYDGQFARIQIGAELLRDCLAGVSWKRTRVPGYLSNTVSIGPASIIPIRFRLRGFRPEELASAVAEREILIGEFWPNTPGEGFRGVNLVRVENATESHDLRPVGPSAFELNAVDSELFLSNRDT